MPYTPQKYDPMHEIIDRMHHTLIAGCSGSGKSEAEKSILYAMLEKPPYDNLFILFDTKAVELVDFQNAPHCAKYTDDINEIPAILEKVIEIMDARFKRMKAQGLKKTNEPILWLVFDEYYDIVGTHIKRQAQPLLNAIAQKGRAAGILLMVCTQRCTRDVISGMVQAQFSVMLGLRTRTSQDSRNILGMSGCEKLPRYGKGILQIDGINKEIEIPLTKEEYIHDRVDSWNRIDWRSKYGNRQ